MNNSVSTTSLDYPTPWPESSFPAGATAVALLGAVAVAVVLGIAGGVVMAFNRNALLAGPNFVAVAIAYQIFFEAAAVAILLWRLPHLAKLSYRELGFTMPTGGQIGVAVVGAIAMTIVVEGVASLIQTMLHQKHEQAVVEMFKQVVHVPSVMWFFAVFAIVIAPFLEETIFRLVIFNVGRRYLGFWPGAIISGICFGAAHLDPYVLLPLALGGIILCYVYARTRNAYASMITHGLFNALTVVALVFAPNLMQ